jgi:hypothetical protein
MDVFTPKHRNHSPTPGVLWIHGGGWERGDKSGNSGAQLFANRRFVTAGLSYHLSVDSPFPAAIEDGKCASGSCVRTLPGTALILTESAWPDPPPEAILRNCSEPRMRAPDSKVMTAGKTSPAKCRRLPPTTEYRISLRSFPPDTVQVIVTAVRQYRVAPGRTHAAQRPPSSLAPTTYRKDASPQTA